MARTRLQEGTLTLDAAAELQHAFERQERRANSVAEKQVGGGRGVTPRPELPRRAAVLLSHPRQRKVAGA